MTTLQFDFNKDSTIFINPIKIIEAYTIDQVVPALKQIQEAIENGFYAAGFLSYEAAPAFEPSMKVRESTSMPLLWFGIFDNTSDDEIKKSDGSFYISDWVPNTSMDHYYQSIHKIKDAIYHGNSYQVNYTLRMSANFQGDTFSFYQKLATSQSANYSAFLDIGDFKILSASPELFFHLKDGKLTTKPMKGTIGRGKTLEEDRENAEWLYHSEKNRAENVMIVDLLRNDLGMIAKPGTVSVPELFSIEEYPTVYQMTSTVTSEIDEDKGILDIFKALFPCGSITGAPKISTMDIIHELETTPRQVYCGAIGFITPNKEAIFNVPIRTVIIDSNGNATYGVGGGITWDSNEAEEYEEVLTKAKILSKSRQDIQLIETIGLKEGRLLLLDNHMERLKNSAGYFNFTYDLVSIKERVLNIADKYQVGNWRIRILLDKVGKFSLDIIPEEPIENYDVALAKSPINQHDIFLYHKTTNRTIYDRNLRSFPHVFDVLLWNEAGEITEFTRGNVVVELEGKLYTPPVTCGLLAGTYRKSLLDQGIIKERIILVRELENCSRIWFINSVKEWVEVQLI
ncbi:aminodeoxychorismate synthase component I [Paucisalibacillus sp. EB02]|uniref:aminodeoxychorismate synthase component I n=1 Tax=Paucisalibacillus sp. EB02 TaxID=1347087 RepID=UPI0004B9DCA4|nr:aminodeoxychorismate synthase component I [Paucisalibacillus sp. EB02]